MKEEEKKKNEEKFLDCIYDTLSKVMKDRPAQPIYEYANMLLAKVDKPKEEYLQRLEQRKAINKDKNKQRKHSRLLGTT